MGFRSLSDIPEVEWLRNAYEVNERSCASIAKELNTHPNTVKRWLVKSGISLRDTREACIKGVRKAYGIYDVPDKRTLEHLHYEEDLHVTDIAKRFDVSVGTASKWLRDNSIVSRGDLYPTGANHKKYVGHGKIMGWFFSRIRLGASNRNIEFDIAIEEIWDLFLAQSGMCALTGMPLTFPRKTRDGVASNASLDRIDSSKPYTIDNVQWVHKLVNKIKQDLAEDQFVQLCMMVADHFREGHNIGEIS